MSRDDGLTELEAEAIEALSEAVATCEHPPAPVEEQIPPASFFPE